MRRPLLFLALAPAVFGEPLAYPETRREAVRETLHEVEITDHYRWLEDDNSKETAAWVKAQNKVTFDFLDAIPARERIAKRLTEL